MWKVTLSLFDSVSAHKGIEMGDFNFVKLWKSFKEVKNWKAVCYKYNCTTVLLLHTKFLITVTVFVKYCQTDLHRNSRKTDQKWLIYHQLLFRVFLISKTSVWQICRKATKMFVILKYSWYYFSVVVLIIKKFIVLTRDKEDKADL